MANSPTSPGLQRAQLGVQAVGRVLAVVALVAVANVLAFKYHRRVDLTRGTVAPLTERTRSFLLGLPKPAKLILFFTAEKNRISFAGFGRPSRKDLVRSVSGATVPRVRSTRRWYLKASTFATATSATTASTRPTACTPSCAR